MPSTLTKVSGLIDDHQEKILKEFIAVHQCSKAKAMGLLLSLWEENNKPKIEKEETIKKSDLVALIDERLTATLTALNLVTNSVTNLDSNNTANLITNSDDKNVTYSDNSNYIANLITNSDSDTNCHNQDSNKITHSLTNSNNQDRNKTANLVTNFDNVENALSESSILPLKEEIGVKLPDRETSQNIGDSQNDEVNTVVNDSAIHTHSVCTNHEKSKKAKELTESQQKVIDNIANIPAGEQLSYSKLAERLEVSRTVLDGFDLWRSYFEVVAKKRGCDYLKL